MAIPDLMTEAIEISLTLGPALRHRTHHLLVAPAVEESVTAVDAAVDTLYPDGGGARGVFLAAAAQELPDGRVQVYYIAAVPRTVPLDKLFGAMRRAGLTDMPDPARTDTTKGQAFLVKMDRAQSRGAADLMTNLSLDLPAIGKTSDPTPRRR